MINKINLTNFKLYSKKTEIPLQQLNLLTGINGRGKSSVLQPFLLLSQSVLANRTTNKIMLNGDNVRLGSFEDVKSYSNSFSESIVFEFSFAEFSVAYFLHNSQPDASELQIDRIELKNSTKHLEDLILLQRQGELYKLQVESPHSEFLQPVSLFDLSISPTSLSQYNSSQLNKVAGVASINRVHYISADRIGPKNYYENRSLSYFESVGPLGENTINLLYHSINNAKQVHEAMLEGYAKLFNEQSEELSKTVEDHTNYWMDKIFQGAKIKVESIKGEDLLKLRINSDGGSNYFKPTNVGYGFSYSLPIIVAGLTAGPGEILVIENPEAHLHPYAQSLIAKFLCLVSSTGVQIIVESHSDHILNGMRVAIKDRIVSSESVNVLYFDEIFDQHFERIEVDSDGGISTWPTNFFDQATNDLNYLLGI